MNGRSRAALQAGLFALAAAGAMASKVEASDTSAIALSPASMARIGTIDERFQSYNVEMLEVTGGKFWRPYGPELAAAFQKPAAASSSGDTPSGMNPTRRCRSIASCETNSNRANHSGSRRQPMQRAAATRGVRPFSTRSAISISWAGSRGSTFRSSLTIRWSRAITDCSTTER
jgi:hypothetical protein